MQQMRSKKDYIFSWATRCELLYGQSEAAYEKQVESGNMSFLDFKRYYVLISGLSRKVYRAYFNADMYEYTKHFEEVERKIQYLVDQQGVSCITTMLLYDHTKRFVMIFSPPETFSAQEVAQTVADSFDCLYARIFDMSKTPYCNYTVLSEELHSYDELSPAFKRIDKLSRQQFFDMQPMIMTPALLEQSRTSADREAIHESLTQLRAALRERNQGDLIAALDAIFAQLRGARDFDLLDSTLYRIRAVVEGVLASCGRELEDAEVFSASQYPTIDHLYEALRRKLLAIIASFTGGPTLSAPIQEVVRYIRHHYAEDISLEALARHIDMSQSWLTKHFNRDCGCSVPQYLLDVRMEHAREMLEKTNMLVFEVGAAVGFENARYFVAVFKKATGMTPSAYREQIRKA